MPKTNLVHSRAARKRLVAIILSRPILKCVFYITSSEKVNWPKLGCSDTPSRSLRTPLLSGCLRKLFYSDRRVHNLQPSTDDRDLGVHLVSSELWTKQLNSTTCRSKVAAASCIIYAVFARSIGALVAKLRLVSPSFSHWYCRDWTTATSTDDIRNTATCATPLAGPVQALLSHTFNFLYDNCPGYTCLALWGCWLRSSTSRHRILVNVGLLTAVVTHRTPARLRGTRCRHTLRVVTRFCSLQKTAQNALLARGVHRGNDARCVIEISGGSLEILYNVMQ